MTTFLDNLDDDLRKALMAQIRDLWTHTSTAIEGNSLTLGDTAFVLREGLTVKGKPLRDHQEVVGHAKAIDIIYDLWVRNCEITEQDLFQLHKAVQTSFVLDYYRPLGEWKREHNGVYTTDMDGKQIFLEFAPPEEVPGLMCEWLALLNGRLAQPNITADRALEAYVKLHIAFVRIHPFFDGNGRMARLLGNLPVLRAGEPPIVIPMEQRREYLCHITQYDLYAGQARLGKPILPHPEKLKGFRSFCEETWSISRELVSATREHQRIRDAQRKEFTKLS